MRKSWKLLMILLKIKMVLLMTCTLKVRIFRKVMAIFVSSTPFTVHYFAYQAIELSGIKLLEGQSKISYL